MEMEKLEMNEQKKTKQNRTKSKQVAFRVTEKEYEKLMKLVVLSGQSQQDFLTTAIINTKVTNLDGLKAVVPEMKRMGNNLNQIAKRLNEGAGAYVTQSQWAELIEGYSEVWQLLKQLIQELA